MLQRTCATSSQATDKLWPSLHVGACTWCNAIRTEQLIAAHWKASEQEVLAAGPDGWSIPSNYPELSDGQILRLDWFILFFQFVTVCVVAIVISLGAVPQVRSYSQHLVMHWVSKGAIA